jgi:hypothetical protein
LQGKEAASFYSYQTGYRDASTGFEEDSIEELIATLKE